MNRQTMPIEVVISVLMISKVTIGDLMELTTSTTSQITSLSIRKLENKETLSFYNALVRKNAKRRMLKKVALVT